MPRDRVPKRILKLRRVGAIADSWSVAPAVFADGRRTLRKWLADPQFSEDLKAGDAERRRSKFHLLTRREMQAFTPEEIEHMVTVELQRTYAEPEEIDAMQEADGQTLH